MPIIAEFSAELIKALIFLLVMIAGVVCGKKFRDHRDANKAPSSES